MHTTRALTVILDRSLDRHGGPRAGCSEEDYALYPSTWTIECDSCGNTARGAQGVAAQGLFVAAVQQGWVLQVNAQEIPPDTTMLCPVCAASGRGRARRGRDQAKNRLRPDPPGTDG